MSSYVIQNFFLPARMVIITPKFRNTALYLFVDKIFFFYSMGFFLKTLTCFSEFLLLKPFLYFKNLFEKNLFTQFYQILHLSKTNYVNNLQKSLTFWNVFNFNNALQSNHPRLQIAVEDELLSNHYLLSIKASLFQINKKFYDKIFFFFLFLDLSFWNTYTQSFKVYNNFLKLNYEIYNYYFISSFFFNIYNY